MQLTGLIDKLNIYKTEDELNHLTISNIEQDSRKVRDNTLLFVLKVPR